MYFTTGVDRSELRNFSDSNATITQLRRLTFIIFSIRIPAILS
jgi:hypothetical protein